MSISKIGIGWANNAIDDLPDRHYLYNKPSEEMTFTGTFMGREALPVRSSWHGIKVYFITDEGERIWLIAHRYYWHNRNGYSGCIGKWDEGVVYSAWNTDFPIDFAMNVIIGSKWKVEVTESKTGVINFNRAEPLKVKTKYGDEELSSKFLSNYVWAKDKAEERDKINEGTGT